MLTKLSRMALPSPDLYGKFSVQSIETLELLTCSSDMNEMFYPLTSPFKDLCKMGICTCNDEHSDGSLDFKYGDDGDEYEWEPTFTFHTYEGGNPLLRDSFLTSPLVPLPTLKPKTADVSDENKRSGGAANIFDEMECRDILEAIAGSDGSMLCVDPNAIFNSPYVASGKSSQDDTKTTITSTNVCSSRATTFSFNTSRSDSSDSGSGSLSGNEFQWSESEEESDDQISSTPQSEEEFEEIDVVALSKTEEVVVCPSSTFVRESFVLPATLFMSERVAALHNYSSRLGHCQRLSSQEPSSASAPQSPSEQMAPVAPKRSLSNPTSPAIIRVSSTRRRYRRALKERTNARLGRVPRAAKVAQGEETCKRAQHNVLERKRRSQLMQNFQCLRDRIPQLKGNVRASKSDILGFAREHALKLHSDSVALVARLRREIELHEMYAKNLRIVLRRHSVDRDLDVDLRLSPDSIEALKKS